MSASEEPTLSGDKTTIAGSSPVDQPNDAVPMRDMAQDSTSNAAPEGNPAPAPATTDDKPGQSSTSNAAAADGEGVDITDAKAPEDTEADNAADAPPPPRKERTDSIAIGPAQDDISAITPGGPDSGPVCNITLLLTSGSRHPYKIDNKYLSRRGVAVPEETEAGLPDPTSISIYTLKELILREWRTDWEARPASPSSIRLIHFGKLLDDKDQLKKYQFSNESPNVVHMSVRPQDLDEEEPKSGSKALGSGSGDGQRRGGGCCIIL